MTMMVRHWDTFRAAVVADRQRATSRLRTDETDFLPAALEIIERPVSPTARMTSWVLMIALVISITWATFGRLDIVVSAPGQVSPSEDVKIIQAADTGVVRAIHVHDNQSVRAGQPLIDLDPTVSAADVRQVEEGYEAAALDAARARAMLSALDGHGLRFVPPAGTPADVVSTQVALAAAELEAIVGASSMHGADRRVAQAARAEARLRAVKLSESVAIVAQEVAANAELLSKGYVSKLRFLELQRQQSALIRDRDIAFETSRKADAQIASADGTLRQANGDARAKVLSALAKSETEVRLRREELVRVRHRTGLQRLVSPIDGMVSQLAVHTVGGVIELAKPIMVVVPSAGRLIGQVKIPTRDAGFVRVGQPVAVKLAAFPFTRYGTARGRVESISPDSIHDDTLGLVFIARIAVERRISGRGGQPIALTPGMEITADIRTGRRSIMNFLVSPLQEVLLKAGRER